MNHYLVLWWWLRDLWWGSNLPRVRRRLVLTILFIVLLGRAAYWARPKLNELLYPIQPPAAGTCTERVLSMSGYVPPGDVAAAKKLANIETRIVMQAYVWNQEKRRVELWVGDGETMWQFELICFEIKTPGKEYVAQLGEFEKASLEDIILRDSEFKANEEK